MISIPRRFSGRVQISILLALVLSVFCLPAHASTMRLGKISFCTVDRCYQVEAEKISQSRIQPLIAFGECKLTILSNQQKPLWSHTCREGYYNLRNGTMVIRGGLPDGKKEMLVWSDTGQTQTW